MKRAVMTIAAAFALGACGPSYEEGIRYPVDGIVRDVCVESRAYLESEGLEKLSDRSVVTAHMPWMRRSEAWVDVEGWGVSKESALEDALAQATGYFHGSEISKTVSYSRNASASVSERTDAYTIGPIAQLSILDERENDGLHRIIARTRAGRGSCPPSGLIR